VSFIYRTKKLNAYTILVGKSDKSRGISVSIVSGYGLDERANEVRSPAEAKSVFL
jgi:hypothetical protein